MFLTKEEAKTYRENVLAVTEAFRTWEQCRKKVQTRWFFGF